jgi:hypothetical protein
VWYLNSMALMERVSAGGGLHWWEHPSDPGVAPYPSIWDTDEMKELEHRFGTQRVSFRQFVFRAPVREDTTISTTCPRHVHPGQSYAVARGYNLFGCGAWHKLQLRKFLQVFD